MAAAEPSAIERHINRSEIQAAKDVWCTEGVSFALFPRAPTHANLQRGLCFRLTRRMTLMCCD